MPDAPGGEQEPVAEVAGVERLLGEGDLDREDEGEEDERDGFGAEEALEGPAARARR